MVALMRYGGSVARWGSVGCGMTQELAHAAPGSWVERTGALELYNSSCDVEGCQQAPFGDPQHLSVDAGVDGTTSDPHTHDTRQDADARSSTGMF